MVIIWQANTSEAIKSYLASLSYGRHSPDLTAAFQWKTWFGTAYCAIGDTAVGMFYR